MVGWEGTYTLEKATEAQLEQALARSALGDQLAFAEIVRQHQGMVFSLACYFLQRPVAGRGVGSRSVPEPPPEPLCYQESGPPHVLAA